MESCEISVHLIDCYKVIYRTTPLQVEQENIYTLEGIKQGCPLSPILFALYIKEVDKTGAGGGSGNR